MISKGLTVNSFLQIDYVHDRILCMRERQRQRNRQQDWAEVLLAKNKQPKNLVLKLNKVPEKVRT